MARLQIISYDPGVIESIYEKSRMNIDLAISDGRFKVISDKNRVRYLKAIYDNINVLSAKKKKVFLLYYSGSSYDEIMKQTLLTKSTVRGYIKRSINKIKNCKEVKDIINEK